MEIFDKKRNVFSETCHLNLNIQIKLKFFHVFREIQCLIVFRLSKNQKGPSSLISNSFKSPKKPAHILFKDILLN